MVDRAEGKTLILRYILGQVSPEERADFEERYFADSDLFEELLAAENDLIDSYARGELSGPDRFRFESRYLATPELRKRVQFSKSLADYSSSVIPLSPAPRWWKSITSPGLGPAARFALTGVIVGLVGCSVLITIGNIQLRRQLEQMSAEQARVQQQEQASQLQITDLNAQLQRLQASNRTQEIAQLEPPGVPLISLTLSPGLPRSTGRASVLPISPGVSTVLLLLKTSQDSYTTYGVSLETPGGRQVLKKDELKALLATSAKVVPVSLPSSALQRGDYVLRLIGSNPGVQSEEVDVYSFRVVMR